MDYPLNFFLEVVRVSTLGTCIGVPSVGTPNRIPSVETITCLPTKRLLRTSVHPSTKSFFDFSEIWYVGRGR